VAQPDVVRRGGKNSAGAQADAAPSPAPGAGRASSPPGTGRPQPRITSSSPERLRWKEMTDGISSIHGNPFDPTRVYHDGDVVLHKQFGMGIVESIAEDGLSMSALFRDGVESLELTPEQL